MARCTSRKSAVFSTEHCCLIWNWSSIPMEPGRSVELIALYVVVKTAVKQAIRGNRRNDAL